MNSKTWTLIYKKNKSYYVSAYEKLFSCQVGSRGLVPYDNKKEGDLSSPKGKWLLKTIYYRADKLDLDIFI